jgi:hypothetical protein
VETKWKRLEKNAVETKWKRLEKNAFFQCFFVFCSLPF